VRAATRERQWLFEKTCTVTPDPDWMAERSKRLVPPATAAGRYRIDGDAANVGLKSAGVLDAWRPPSRRGLPGMRLLHAIRRHDRRRKARIIHRTVSNATRRSGTDLSRRTMGRGWTRCRRSSSCAAWDVVTSEPDSMGSCRCPLPVGAGASRKGCAENTMIVDLGRNDLSRVQSPIGHRATKRSCVGPRRVCGIRSSRCRR